MVYDFFGFVIGVDFGVIEEIDVCIVCCGEVFVCDLLIDLVVVCYL